MSNCHIVGNHMSRLLLTILSGANPGFLESEFIYIYIFFFLFFFLFFFFLQNSKLELPGVMIVFDRAVEIDR